MSNWIEEAERRQKQKECSIRSTEESLNETVNQNYLEIQPFISALTEMVKRVNQISPEERKPSQELGFTHSQGEQKFEFYGSANLVRKKKYAFVLTKDCIFLCWRRIFFKITEIPGEVVVTIHEKTTSDDQKRNTRKRKFQYRYKIEEFSKQQVGLITDWLVYRISNNDLLSGLPRHLR